MGDGRGIEDIAPGTHLAPRSFYRRSPELVARELLGATLVHMASDGACAGLIVETEAYLGANDEAAHSRAGRTERTKVIFGPPGRAYVYKVYGIHWCLNVVAEPSGSAGCVLLRSLEPTFGIPQMASRRNGAIPRAIVASGPGRLTRAMGIDGRLNGADYLAGPLTIRLPDVRRQLPTKVTTRVGIRRSAELPLRFCLADNPSVSRPWP